MSCLSEREVHLSIQRERNPRPCSDRFIYQSDEVAVNNAVAKVATKMEVGDYDTYPSHSSDIITYRPVPGDKVQDFKFCLL